METLNTENLTLYIIPASFNLVLRRLLEPAGYAVENVEPEMESTESRGAQIYT